MSEPVFMKLGMYIVHTVADVPSGLSQSISKVYSINHLPQSIKILVVNEKSFKVSLKRFLYHHSFYSMQEYYQHMENK
jgi:hypothetical protein